MGDLGPLVELFAATDDRLDRVNPTWWGAAVSDRRYPLIWDVNYARVEGARPDLTLDEVEEALLPALRESAAAHEHVVLFDPGGSARLLGELEARGHRIGWDTAMELHGPLPEPLPEHRVEEVVDADEAFWARQRDAFVHFDVTEPAALDQLVAWERDVLLPFGKRWFAVRVEDEVAGTGALLMHGATGYVDNVVTFPEARRRGVATAIVGRIVGEAREAGARRTFLLAEQPNAIRLYERLGFRSVGRVASSLRPLPEPR